jgi:hypothetical protein
MKLHRIFALIGAVTLLALLLSVGILFGLSQGSASDAGGFIGIAFLGAFVILAAIFILSALPFAWLTTWLFWPMAFPDKLLPLAPSKKRVYVAYTWNIVAGSLAGGLIYSLHNVPALKPLYAELNEQGGLYLSAIGGYTIGLIVPCIVLSILSLHRLKQRFNFSAGTFLYGIFTLIVGILIMIGLLRLDSSTVTRPDFTVYTPNDVSVKQYDVRYSGLDGSWPARVEVWLGKTGSDPKLYQTATTATDAFNPKTQSCVPQPYNDKSFYTDFKCTYVATSEKGTRIYKDENGFNSFFVINGTYLMYDAITQVDTNFVDNLVPGELSGASIKPMSNVAPLKFSLFAPSNYSYSIESSEYSQGVLVPYTYSYSGGSFFLDQEYTSQPKPSCATKPFSPDKRDSLCKVVFITSGKREIYEYDSWYFVVLDTTEITISNLPYPAEIRKGQKQGLDKEEFMQLIDSLEPIKK